MKPYQSLKINTYNDFFLWCGFEIQYFYKAFKYEEIFYEQNTMKLHIKSIKD